MSPERWAQIEELFHRAAECEPNQRIGLLDEACSNDPDLRREVEVLLSCDDRAGDHIRATVRSELTAVGFPLLGKTVSHYRILDGVGGGGMGLVYRAEDIKLGRMVALKFLPEDSAKDPLALGRFEREARAASALEHPNICPIYEFGEYEGQPFLVMQLLEGQTLAELISAAAHGKPALDLDKLLNLAIQITEGLDAAHSQGIIHRDIKPANIFVTSQRQAKILDFGLVKLARAQTPGNESEWALGKGDDVERLPPEIMPKKGCEPLLSLTGVAMGTAGYMSPEQVRGEKLDARTDLFSLGSVLYEMATGQRAFKGDTGPVLREAILNQTPRPARQLNAELPPKLEKIINRALQKDREARYCAGSEMRTDLQALRRETESRRLPSWATLSGAAVVLAASLATGGYFAFRSPATRSTEKSQSMVKPTAAEQVGLTDSQRVDLEARDDYLKGRYYWNKRTQDDLNKAFDYFARSISRDPNYALPYSGLADYYLLISFYGVPPSESFPKAKAAALRALEIDDSLAEAHTSLASVKAFYEWDWSAGEQEFKRAIALNPNYATARQWYAYLLVATGRFDEATTEMKQAQALDPLSMIIQSNLASNYYYRRQYKQAIDECKKTLEFDPNFATALVFLSAAYAQEKQYDEAISQLKKVPENSTEARALLGYVYAVSGKRDHAHDIFRKLQEKSKREYVPSSYFAMVYLGLGRRDRALALLERGYVEHDQGMNLLKIDPVWDSLRSDPRFQDLLRRVGLPH